MPIFTLCDLRVVNYDCRMLNKRLDTRQRHREVSCDTKVVNYGCRMFSKRLAAVQWRFWYLDWQSSQCGNQLSIL